MIEILFFMITKCKDVLQFSSTFIGLIDRFNLFFDQKINQLHPFFIHLIFINKFICINIYFNHFLIIYILS